MQKTINANCGPQLNTHSQHFYALQNCYNNIDNGFSSHIRGKGSHLAPHTHIFPGTFPQGSVAGGANGPIYIFNPPEGGMTIIQLKREHDGAPPEHYKYWTRFY